MWAHHGQTTSKQWVFVSVLGAYFAEILKATASCVIFQQRLKVFLKADSLNNFF